jgi:hypothetical protein
MTTSLKRPAKAQPEKTSKSAAKVRAKTAPKAPSARAGGRSGKTKQASKPFFRFYHSESLRAKTLGVLHDIETAKDGTGYRNALADVVVELTDSGMDYFFLRPLKIADAGFIIQQSANLGMAGTTRVLGSVIRNVIGRMDERQLLAICGYIRQLML